jgi:AcrR family transcriptional regulator
MNVSSPTRQATKVRREREKARRRDEILSAAERVFAGRGFEAATMEQIAQEAEYATGTIYLYFKDKNALYAALFADKLAALVDRVEQAAHEKSRDPVENLRKAIRAQFEFHDANRKFFEVLMRHASGPPPLGKTDWNLIWQTLMRHHAIMVELIARLQRGKIIRKGDSEDFATALLGMVAHLTRGAMVRQTFYERYSHSGHEIDTTLQHR